MCFDCHNFDPRSQDEQIEWARRELVAHLMGHCIDLCAHCYEDHEVRGDWLGQEGVNLYDNHSMLQYCEHVCESLRKQGKAGHAPGCGVGEIHKAQAEMRKLVAA